MSSMFDEWCAKHGVTPEERSALVTFLATFRAQRTLRALADAPSPPETPATEGARKPSPWMDPNHAFGPPRRVTPDDDRSRCERCHSRVLPSDFNPGEPVVCLECCEAAASPVSAPRSPATRDGDPRFAAICRALRGDAPDIDEAYRIAQEATTGAAPADELHAEALKDAP